MSRSRFPWLVAGMLGFMLFAVQGFAGESVNLKVQIDEKVVYCDARWPGDVTTIRKALQSGVSLTLMWQMDIHRLRPYWFNKKIASVQAARRVRADLLSHRWILEDIGGGITHAVFSVDEAVAFLVGLNNFPLLDKSLLAAGATYRLSLTARLVEGDMPTNWWARLWGRSGFEMSLDFRLPRAS